jgi:hypothetical protein
MTTGTLPTFIEAALNFGGSEISEDNIIDQLRIVIVFRCNAAAASFKPHIDVFGHQTNHTARILFL